MQLEQELETVHHVTCHSQPHDISSQSQEFVSVDMSPVISSQSQEFVSFSYNCDGHMWELSCVELDKSSIFVVFGITEGVSLGVASLKKKYDSLRTVAHCIHTRCNNPEHITPTWVPSKAVAVWPQANLASAAGNEAGSSSVVA
jgi:hypothetical protein